MKIKKILALTAGLLAAISLSVGLAAKSTGTVSLLDKGLALINQVDILAQSKEYIELFSTSKEIADVITDIGSKEYTKPKAVFELKNLDEIFLDNISEKPLPENIKTMLAGKFSNAFPVQLNAINGVMTMAATAVVTHSESFIYEGLKAPTTYLYIFDNSNSFMVTFVPNDENIIIATANVIISEELATCTTLKAAKKLFNDEMELKKLAVSSVSK